MENKASLPSDCVVNDSPSSGDQMHAIPRTVLKSVGVGVLLAIVMVLTLFLSFVVVHMTHSKNLCELPRVDASDVLARAQTGDLILTVSPWSVGVPLWERVIQHSGIVWDHPTLGPSVVEYVRRFTPEPRTGYKGRDMSVMPLREYFADKAHLVIWRPLVDCPSSVREEIGRAIRKAGNRQYSPLLGKQDPFLFFGIGMTHVSTSIAHWIAKLRGHPMVGDPDEDGTLATTSSTFCSAFVLDVLRYANAIDSNPGLLVKLRMPVGLTSPSAFLKSYGSLDASAKPGVRWGDEFHVVNRETEETAHPSQID